MHPADAIESSGVRKIPALIEKALGEADRIEAIAVKYYERTSCMFIGRGASFPIALEGALKPVVLGGPVPSVRLVTLCFQLVDKGTGGYLPPIVFAVVGGLLDEVGLVVVPAIG